MKQWYESLFENYGKKYDEESYVQGTVGECDFIEKEIGFNKTLRILDIGCGTGRHTIELTRRGYAVTGIDLSESQLNCAREKSRALSLHIDFQQHDARKMPFHNEFDLALMLCEAAFPLMETDEMNFEILCNAARVLKSPGKLILTTLNGLFPLVRSLYEFNTQSQEKEIVTYEKGTFDIMTFRDYNTVSIEDDLGSRRQMNCNERYYVPPEIQWLLKTAGFDKIDIYGARLGAFSREHALTADDFEMLVIAEK